MRDEKDRTGLRPVREGLFVFEDGHPAALSGGRCERCGKVSFPARRLCGACPPGTEIRPYRLSPNGIVYTWTVVHVRSALGHQPPYAYGYVDLPDDGTRIFAPLAGGAETVWRCGLPVSLTFAEVQADAMHGILGYAFMPEGISGDV
jgi:uncharacterized OB-fold protein